MADKKQKEPTARELILKVLTDFYPTNSSGGRVIQLLGAYYLIQNGSTSQPIFTDLADTKATPDDETLYRIYCSLYDQRQIAPQLVLEARVTIEEWQKLQWQTEPKVIKGVDGTVLGRIGIAYKEKRRRGNSTLAVILISEDGSWTTVTCYTESNPTETQTAVEDIEAYMAALEGIKAIVSPL